MLLRFRVSNYTSFDETQEFSMVAGKPRLKMNHVLQDTGINTLKFSAIYGANAAGKSNIIKAIKNAQEIILSGTNIELKNRYCRINPDNKNKPSTFEFDIKIDDKYYSYGISVILSENLLVEEWLFELAKSEDTDSQLLYSREYNAEEKSFHDNFEGFSGNAVDVLNAYAEGLSTDTDSTFLSIFNQKKKGLGNRYPSLVPLLALNEWFSSTLSVVTPNKDSFSDFLAPVQSSNKLPIKNFSVTELEEYLRVLGLGINNVCISDITREELNSQFLGPELNRLADSIPASTEKEENQQKYSIIKARIKEENSSLAIAKSDIDELKIKLDMKYPSGYPEIETLNESIKLIKNDLNACLSQRDALEKTNGDSITSGNNTEYLNIVRNIEDKQRSLDEIRKTKHMLFQFKKLSEIIIEQEKHLRAMEKGATELQEKIKMLEATPATVVGDNNSEKSHLILNTTPFSCNIIYFTPRGADEEPEIKKIEFGHGKNNTHFAFSEESDGTKRMVELLEILWAAKHCAKHVYIVDEVDRSLHPDLTRNLIETYLSYLEKDSETQLIVTTHESRIMDLTLLRQDEIWFVDKNAEGISSIYSLDEYDERFDRKVDKAYFEGRYGAIPMFNVYFPVKNNNSEDRNKQE